MAAYAVGADEHQGADRIDGRGADVLGGDIAASGDGIGDHGGLVRVLGQPAVAFGDGRALRRPAGAAQLVHDGPAIVVQFAEEALPAGIDGARVAQKARVQLGDELRVGAEEEGVLLWGALCHFSLRSGCGRSGGAACD